MLFAGYLMSRAKRRSMLLLLVLPEWDPACIDREALSDCAIHGLYESATGGLSDKATVNPMLRLVPPGEAGPVKTVRKTMKEHKIFPPDSLPYRLAEQLLAKIFEHLPGYKPPDLQRWARQMDALLRLTSDRRRKWRR